jgi:hypothetical protein
LVLGLILAQTEESALIGKRYVRKGLLGHGTKLAWRILSTAETSN